MKFPRWLGHFRVAMLWLAICVTAALAVAADIVKPIPFYGGRLVGYEKSGVLKTTNKLVMPSDREHMFVTLKLEIEQPFPYVRGRFSEIVLTDEFGALYQHKGLLSDQGWLLVDKAKVEKPLEPIATLEPGEDGYPDVVDITFEVPIASDEVRLKFKDSEVVLYGPSK